MPKFFPSLFALVLVPCLVAAEVPKADPLVGAQIIDQYLQAMKSQGAKTRNLFMHTAIEASLPGSGKTARMEATRYVAENGEVSYTGREIQGDNSVKKDVIARYLEEEQKATSKPGMRIDETNYKFKYYGLFGEGDWKLHLFEVSARRKVPELFNGWIWIEDSTKLPVREQGLLSKSPSVWLKKLSFVRDYLIKEGVAYPYRIESFADVRIVGRAEIKVEYSKHTSGSPR